MIACCLRFHTHDEGVFGVTVWAHWLCLHPERTEPQPFDCGPIIVAGKFYEEVYRAPITESPQW